MSEHGSHRKQYLMILIYLAVLTVLEIAVASPELGLNRGLVALGLVSMALAKAGLVLFYYMHLKDENRVLRNVVLLPFFFPPFYAIVLMAEGYARLHGIW